VVRAAIAIVTDAVALGQTAGACGGSGVMLAAIVIASVAPHSPVRSVYTVGYTEFRTNLPGGRHVNQWTMRACVVRADGVGRRKVAAGLARKPHTWTQFAGWSPDGSEAVVINGWESPENGEWEEAHKQFHFDATGWQVDTCLVSLRTGRVANVTAVERVSHYNAGLFFWPGNPMLLGFTPLIGGESRPFRMDRDGRNKTDLSQGAGFTYGYSASPDGRRIAYHKDYQVYIADADGKRADRVDTGQPFNFAPQWSPDGSLLLFLAGEHYDCHPHVVRADGTGLRQLASRRGWEGVAPVFDVLDHHGGSSDVPVWSRDGRWIYFTARIEGAVELMRVSADGSAEEQLTHSPAGALNYHPTPSPDGRRLAFGSTRDGARALYVAGPDGSDVRPITRVRKGWGAMWPHWRPGPR